MSTPREVPTTVQDNHEPAPEVRELTLDTPFEGWQAGQFCTLVFEGGGETHRKPYSIASAPWEQDVKLCIKALPDGSSSHIPELTPGTQVRVMGPLGTFTIKHEKQDILLIGAGTGVAPLRAMVKDLFSKHFGGPGPDTEKNVTLLQGAPDEDHLLYKEEFERLSKEAENFKYRTALSRTPATERNHGYVHHRLDAALEDTDGTEAYVCGLTRMVEDTKAALLNKGVPETNIHTERYG